MGWHKTYSTEVLFYGKDILVVAKDFRSPKCVVTFSSRAASPGEYPLSPFASQLLEKAECSYIAFIAMSSHWWQTPEFEPAVGRVREYLDTLNLEEVILYGGSMGAVGAIHASAGIRPNKAVLFGAQYGISPSVVPWDSRWHADARTLQHDIPDACEVAWRDCEYIWLLDPFTLDNTHLKLYQKFIAPEVVPLPFSGHECFRTLKELGLAGFVARELLLTGGPTQPKVANIVSCYRAARRRSSAYWRNLAHARKHRGRSYSSYLEKAAETDPTDIRPLLDLGLFYLNVELSPLISLQKYDRAIRSDPDHAGAWRGRTKALAALGDQRSAVESAVGAVARRRSDADLSRVLIEAAFKFGSQDFLRHAVDRYRNIDPEFSTNESLKRILPSSLSHQLLSAESRDSALDQHLRKIQMRRPRRYSQLLHHLLSHSPKEIVEIGVFDGKNAVDMISAATAIAPEHAHITYIGFDLFDMMNTNLLDKEFSKVPAPVEEVEQLLAGCPCSPRLIRGYTKDTLPAFLQERPLTSPLEFVFVDGGHSEETIAADWDNLRPFVSSETTVFFDDYYVDASPQLRGLGCNKLIDTLQAQGEFKIDVLPIVDEFVKDWGCLSVAMVRVTVLSNV